MDATHKDDLCPICLEHMADDEEVLKMPDCKHRLHVRCALSAVHYDRRCPVCRHDTLSQLVVSSEPDMVTQFELQLAQHEAFLRAYQRRRSRCIRRRDSLKKLEDRFKNERRCFQQAEKDLDRAWAALQRHLWASDAHIQSLKTIRRRHQRRVGDLSRRLRERLDPVIGPPPSDFDM